MNITEAIAKSNTLKELHRMFPLPEPYDERGFYFFYYAEADYKQALRDIVSFIDGGMRIYYDRMLEGGAAWQRDYLVKCRALHCRCVVFYLSRNALYDDTFIRLCETVYENRIPYVSVNLAVDGGIWSGEQLIEKYGDGLPEKFRRIISKLFSDEITYIPDTYSVGEKQLSLEKAHVKPPFVFSVDGDGAVIDYIRDITEEEIAIPEKALIGDCEYTVKAIAPAAFAGCGNLKRIELPPTIESIGVGADTSAAITSMQNTGRVFDGCKSLEEIVLPASVRRLATGCFTGCRSLKRIILNDGARFTGDNAYNLFNLGEAVSYQNFYDEPTEKNGIVLKELRLNGNIRKTGEDTYIALIDGAWQEFSPPDAEKIWGYDDRKTESDYYVERDADPSFLSGLENPERVTFAPDWRGERLYNCFAGCINLKSVSLPEGCRSLDGTFEGCVSLEEITLPRSLKRIGDMTFSGCISLKEITLPENVDNVAPDAFGYCEEPVTLTVDNIRCRKLFKGGLRLNRNNAGSANIISKLLGIIRTSLYVLFHFKTFLLLLRRKAFYYNTGINTIYVKKKVRIKGFKLSRPDRDGYFKYVRKGI